MPKTHFLVALLTLAFSTSLLAPPAVGYWQDADDAVPSDPPARWWKGNLHTHSFWSDGNDFPEMISEWYRVRGYHFLAISDHNTLQEGDRWMKYDTILKRGGKEAIVKYQKRFGGGWIETKGEEGTEDYQFRLKPLDEYRYLLEERGKFILIPAEEITDRAGDKPVHMNATNLVEKIEPLGGKTVREVMENNLRSVLEQEKAKGREILPHLNHPNFGYGITFEDLAAVVSERFFEVYNGHPGVNHLGNEENPGVERMWDLANHLRINKLQAPVLMGVATDDSHEYHGKPGSRPGRGWVMVRSRYLTPEHLIRAMKAGDFYASSGVMLRDVQWDADSLTLEVRVDPQEGEECTIEFLVTSSDAEGEQIGRVAATSTDKRAKYQLQEGESFVRAVITSNLAPDDPVLDNQKRQAWTQPFARTNR